MKAPTARPVPQAIRDIITEREAQIAKGYDEAHDDGHFLDNKLMAFAHEYLQRGRDTHDPDSRRLYLVRAASLIVAQIECMDRIEA